MLIPLLIFIISLAITIKGADLFVDAAERIAKLLGISDFTIGLTLVAVGTSIPELATSIISALTKTTDIAAGTIIGSNIANIGLILGISSLIMVMDFKKPIYHRDTIILLGISILFYIFALDLLISRKEGILLLLIFLLYLSYILRHHPPETEEGLHRLLVQLYRPGKINTLKTYEQAISKGLSIQTYRKLLGHGIDVRKAYREKLKHDVIKQSILAIFGVITLYFGAKYLVSSTGELASLIGITKETIAITVIAVGTSVPELTVSLAAAKKRLGNILVGNLVGSCIANLLLIGGISSIISPTLISRFDLYFAIPIMIMLTIMFLRYLQTKWLSRVLEGIILLFLYALFMTIVILFQVLGA